MFPTDVERQEAIATSEAQGRSGPGLFESYATSKAEYESESSGRPAADTIRRPLDIRPRPNASATADVNSQGLHKRRKTKHANWDGESLWDDASQKKAPPVTSTPIEPPTGKARRRANDNRHGIAQHSLKLSFSKCQDIPGFVVRKVGDPNSTPRIVAPPVESESQTLTSRTKKRRAIRPLEDDEDEPVAPRDSRDATASNVSTEPRLKTSSSITKPRRTPHVVPAPKKHSAPVPSAKSQAFVRDEPSISAPPKPNKKPRRDTTVSWICCDVCDTWRIVPAGVCVDPSLPWKCEQSKIWGGNYECTEVDSNDEIPPAELLRRSNSSESIVIVASAHGDSESRLPSAPQRRADSPTVESAIALQQLKTSRVESRRDTHEEPIEVDESMPHPHAQRKSTKDRKAVATAKNSAQRAAKQSDQDIREEKRSDQDLREEIVTRVRHRKQSGAPVAVDVAKLFDDVESQTGRAAGFLCFERRRRLAAVFRVRTRI